MATYTQFEPPEPWFTPLQRAGRALCEFIAHAIVLIGILSVMKVIETITIMLGSADKVYRIYKIAIPQAQVFDACDLALLVCILIIGVRATTRKYVENPLKPGKDHGHGEGAWK